MVVAVLLDNFTTAANEEKERDARQKSDSDGRYSPLHSRLEEGLF